MQLPDQVVARLGRLSCLHPCTRVQFRLPDASDFGVILSRESGEPAAVARLGEVDDASLVLEMSQTTLDAIMEGRLSARHAFLLGDITYSGDRELAAALADLFPAA
ncbi:SCP2 sterol-binding domain-containing protein [Microbulbifer yueqingensis]|uniref:SCP-2 sterol transfer family protein n=1 Tax=Microbulbifer yueqingensis TaxID=658219 RepID=A0A1G9AJL5_9GAMM|nr:SCP2 sterol-binding domain-containing protein [Microbulbifer yueqingensis]SDK27542.1 SCP-2 sterol transfer family protein [Microbulbifer yueqingensis]